MQSFPLEPALDYSTHVSPHSNSLAAGIASARRSLQSAARHLQRAARRLTTLAAGSNTTRPGRKLAVVANDLRRAVEHAPMLALVMVNGSDNQDEELKNKLARQTMKMTALLKHLLREVERDLESATRRQL